MKKVLVVDDSSAARQPIVLALTQAGFEVVEAASGNDGLRTMDRDPLVGLVICDVNMPRMNGLELVAAVKAKPRYASLPIVLLTTQARPRQVERAKQMGAKGWIVRPFKANLLVAAVRKLMAVPA